MVGWGLFRLSRMTRLSRTSLITFGNRASFSHNHWPGLGDGDPPEVGGTAARRKVANDDTSRLVDDALSTDDYMTNPVYDE